MATKDGRKTGGRQRGTVNKRTQDVLDKLGAMNCDPIEGMAKIAVEAMGTGDHALAGQMFKELAQYVAPKRKAIEMDANIGGDAFEQWLQSLK